MSETARLALPLLTAGQAQKEVTVNEALQLLDLVTQARVVAVGLDQPPAVPVEGQCWVVGEAPVDAWTGHAGALAGWTAGGWRFVAPVEGMTLWSAADACGVTRSAGAWQVGTVAGQRLAIGGVQVVGPRASAIASATGGGVVDAEARGALEAILATLRGHGLIAT